MGSGDIMVDKSWSDTGQTLVRHWTNRIDPLVGIRGGNRVDIIQKAA